MTREGSQLFLQVIERYEKGSTLITSNLNFSQWNQVFDDVNLTAALLDRLTHHNHIHQFTWESIRFHESMKQQKSKLDSQHWTRLGKTLTAFPPTSQLGRVSFQTKI